MRFWNRKYIKKDKSQFLDKTIEGYKLILVYDILINCTFYKSYDIIQTRQSEGPLYEIHA
jgi:hypothetical protein